MPYKELRDLPAVMRDCLPLHAQEIYLRVFNKAWDTYGDPDKCHGSGSREEIACRVAWSVVKKEFVKDNQGHWRKAEAEAAGY